MTPFDPWETHVEETSRRFDYPPTPDIASAVRQSQRSRRRSPVAARRVGWTLATLGLLIAGLLLVPSVRAGLLEVLRIGAVRIFLVEPTPLPPPTAPAVQPSSAPQPTATPLSSVLDLQGETTLADAQKQVDFPIRLPTYPADLGPPDKVFVQHFGDPLLILVWLDPNQPERVRMTLYCIPPGPLAEKSRPKMIKSTAVNGRAAIWGEGPHIMLTRSGEHVLQRLVAGHVLIWTEGNLTYRIEIDLSEAEAMRIAESLR